MVFAAAASNSARRTSAAQRQARVQRTELLSEAGQMGGYGSIAIDQEGIPSQHSVPDALAEVDDNDAYEIADDKNPVSAYIEIATIRQLLLEHVDVVLTPDQINSPDVQLNLVQPLWQAMRERCGVWQRGDMRHCRWAGAATVNDSLGRTAAGGKAGGPLASGAMLYSTLANRDYFMILASVGQSQAELHESRAGVAETLAIMCAKALHSQGRQVLANALCAKFTPIDTDGLRAKAAHILDGGTQSGRLPLLLRGDRHMSLLSEDQRVRIYRLGQAGGLAANGPVAGSPGAGGVVTGAPSGYATPAQELAQDYLAGGSRIVAERTLEVAIRCEAKRFTAQKLVGNVVHMLWDGSIHWKGFRCVCLRASPGTGGPTPAGPSQPALPLLPLPVERRASNTSISSSDAGDGAGVDCRRARLEAWLGRVLAPLRVPMLENVLTMVHALFFLTVYSAVSLQRKESVTVEEAVMHVFALAYVADEVRQCQENGLAVYIKSVWNVLDVAIHTVFAVFLGLRLRSLYTGSAADLDKAYDVLALNSVMLWPRLFSILDQYEFCGTVIIQVRRIISGTSLFFALLLVMAAGFFQTFYALSLRHNGLEASNIWGLMTRIFFGSALLGWDQADLFGPYVGYLVMTLFIGVSMLILYNILIGLINQCMMEIEQNAAQEFRFAYTMRVTEYVSANQTYPCVPPLNLLQIAVFWPLRKMSALSLRSFVLFRSLLLLLVYAPHLLAYAAFGRASRWWRARSGMHHEALRAECHQAEQELALIKTRRNDGEDLAETSEAAAPEGSATQSPAPTVGGSGGRGTSASGRWSGFADAWRSRRFPPHQQPSPDAGCQPDPDQAERLAKLESQLARLEAQLATFVRLLHRDAAPERDE
ncbi:hypothetical protein H4R19_003804 [Coemansia spiralis]|nr:hypothetical protein H4R19_003804 [Coemansia spiralis]